MTVRALIDEGLQSLGRGELDEAAFYFEEVVARDPHNATAASYLRHLSRSGYRSQRGGPKSPPYLAGWMAPPPQTRKYKVLKKVAQGGICEIYLAEETEGSSPGRRCVLKLLRRSYLGDPNLQGAMKTEAQILSLLRHPNIVQFYGPVRISDREGLALELLEGSTVHTLSQLYNGRPTMAEGLAIMAQAFEVLGYVHKVRGPEGRGLNIVHRDIAPGNIFLTSDGRVKLLDFGVSRWARSIHKTKQGVLKGTPSFMSPEQAKGAHVTASSDLFSAGLVLLGLLTGAGSPFQRGSLGATLIAVSEGLRPRVAELLPTAPAILVELLESLVAQSPKDRPQDATEVATLLRHAIDGLGVGVGRAALQDVALRARPTPRTLESTASGVRPPALPPEALNSVTPVLETDSLAHIFESIQGHIDELVPTARTLNPLPSGADEGGFEARGERAEEPESAETPIEGLQAIGFQAHEAHLLDGGEDEADTVVVAQPSTQPAAQPGSEVAAQAIIVEPRAPAQDTPEADAVAALPRPRRALGLSVALVVAGLLVLAARLIPHTPGGASLQPSLPARAEPAQPQPVEPSPLQPGEPAIFVDGPGLAQPDPSSGTPARTVDNPEPPEAKTQPVPHRRARKARRARTRSRQSRPAPATVSAGAEPAFGTITVRCPVSWRLSIAGVAELSAEGRSSARVPPGTYRIALRSGARRHVVTALVVADSPVRIECPWTSSPEAKPPSPPDNPSVPGATP